MTDGLADVLPREIERISAKRDRWIQMAHDHPELAPGMNMTIAIMQTEIAPGMDIKIAIIQTETGIDVRALRQW